MGARTGILFAAAIALLSPLASATTVVRAEVIHTVTNGSITDGVIVIGDDGTIEAVGPAASIAIPSGAEVLRAAVAIPGLVDVRGTLGLTGIYNVDHDQDVLDRSSPIQPALRAIDAYNANEPLIAYVRGYGVTTAHTGHGPGELMSGQTMIVKLRGNSINDAVINPTRTIAVNLGPSAHRSGASAPGTRGKAASMLRQKLIDAEAYAEKVRAANAAGDDEAENAQSEKKQPPARNLEMEALASALAGELPLMIRADKAQDIATAMRLAEEFGFTLWLESAAEAPQMMDEIKAAGVPVILHPTMVRAYGERSNKSYATAAKLAEADVPFAIMTGFEGYVPKVRVVLFEAGVAAGIGGLGFDRALQAVTIDAARILGIDERVGSIEVGKDGDIALYDGDPFEYTTHCIGTLIEGELFAGEVESLIDYP